MEIKYIPFLFMLFLLPISYANVMDSCTNFSYKMNFTVTGSNIPTNGVVKLALSNTTFNFSHAGEIGNDIRIKNSTGDGDLNFFTEYYVPGDAIIFVNISDQCGSGCIYWICYGNTTASSVSNPNTTFDAFFTGDAETGAWNPAPFKNTSWSYGIFGAKGYSYDPIIDYDYTFSTGITGTVEYVWNQTETATITNWLGLRNEAGSGDEMMVGHQNGGTYASWDGNEVVQSAISQSIGIHKIKIKHDGSIIQAFIDDVNIRNKTDTDGYIKKLKVFGGEDASRLIDSIKVYRDASITPIISYGEELTSVNQTSANLTLEERVAQLEANVTYLNAKITDFENNMTTLSTSYNNFKQVVSIAFRHLICYYLKANNMTGNSMYSELECSELF